MTDLEEIKALIGDAYAKIQDARHVAARMGRPDIAARTLHCEEQLLELGRHLQAEPIPRGGR